MKHQKFPFAAPLFVVKHTCRYSREMESFLKSSPCFSQYFHRENRGEKGNNARKHLKALTSRTAKSRVKTCQERFKKFCKLLSKHENNSLQKLEHNVTGEEGKHVEHMFSGEEKVEKERVISAFHQYCRDLKEKVRDITDEAVEYYKKKARELEKKERSQSESKKSAIRSMDEHWEITTIQQEHSVLNDPKFWDHVLEYLPQKDLGSLMGTCSQMLHFVHYRVPVQITAPDMGNLSFNRWLKRFHHFHSLDCISLTNATKETMYRNLAALAKNSRIDGLKLGQAASLKPKYFKKFQKSFQKNQHHLVNLTVEASLIPCFLTEEQLGRLETLTLLNLNKENSRATSWVEMLPKMTKLETLTLSSFDFNLKEVHLPATLKKLKVISSDTKIVEGAFGAKKDFFAPRGHHTLVLPTVEHCGQLKEMWLHEVEDLSALPLLPHSLNMLKLHAPHSDKIVWPTSIHAARLEVSSVLPPPRITHICELTVAADTDPSEMLQFLSSRSMRSISTFRVAYTALETELDLLSIVQWERALHEGATFEISETSIHFSPKTVVNGKYSLLFKYGFSEYAHSPKRCMIRGTPIQEAPHEWFVWLKSKGECITKMNRKLRSLKKRKRPESGYNSQPEPPFKKQKLTQ